MPIRDTLQEREYDKFVESPARPNGTAVEVISYNGALSNIKWDSFDYQYPSSTQEIIRFYDSAILKATVTLNYTSSSKENLLGGSVVLA